MLVFALYKQLFANKNINEIAENLSMQIRENGLWLVLLSFILMFCNWGLEALKWKLIINKVVQTKFLRAFKAVWTGVTLGLFTPNRIGEYGGKILYLPKKFRIHGAIVSIIGSFAQILVTLSIGIIATIIFAKEKHEIEPFIFSSLIVLSIVAIIILFIAYYNFDIIIWLFKKIKRLRRASQYVSILQVYQAADYTKYLAVSLARYGVYTAQYLIFLKLFGVSLHFEDGIIAVSVIFLAQTIIPTFAITELITRGSIALLIMENYTDNQFAPIAASTCMWILNLILPAVLGYIFIIRYNFFKK